MIKDLLSGNNFPDMGKIAFDSSDHMRFQNGMNVSGHNYGCHRRFVIEKNIEGHEGYTITLFNLDGIHPFWGDNVQMAPKQMHITNIDNNVVELRGYGYDPLGSPFSDYGIILLLENGEIERVQLNMYDRNISIVYFK